MLTELSVETSDTGLMPTSDFFPYDNGRCFIVISQNEVTWQINCYVLQIFKCQSVALRVGQNWHLHLDIVFSHVCIIICQSYIPFVCRWTSNIDARSVCRIKVFYGNVSICHDGYIGHCSSIKLAALLFHGTAIVVYDHVRVTLSCSLAKSRCTTALNGLSFFVCGNKVK